MSLFGHFAPSVKARSFLSDATAYFSAANALADSLRNLLGLFSLEEAERRSYHSLQPRKEVVVQWRWASSHR